MAFFYCKCLTCNNTGNIKTDSDECAGNFICSKCGSTDVITTYCSSKKAIAQCIASEDDDDYAEEAYNTYDDDYEYAVFEEERVFDKMMMAPTGWEDDKDIQDYIGLSPEDVPEED